jgi:hypothetical protein
MRASIALSTLCLLAAACGTTAVVDGGAIDAGLTGPQACNDLATAECNLRNSCSNGFDISVSFGTLATCVSRLQTSCVAALAAPGTGATPEHYEGCAQAETTESCSSYYDALVPSVCQPQAGTATTGSACAFDSQCQSSFCAVANDQVCGACAAQPQAGDSCAISGCGVELICLKDILLCAVVVTDGGACTDPSACGTGVSCLGLYKGDAGTCTPEGNVGSQCDDEALLAPQCDNSGGAYCERGVHDAGICQPTTLATSDSPCGTVSGVATACGTAGLCVKSLPDAGTGSCVAYVTDGNSCNSVTGPPCLPPAACVPTSDAGTAGTCTLANGSCQ